MHKIQKLLLIALGALPIPAAFTIFALVNNHNFWVSIVVGIFGWVLAFLIGLGTQLSFDKNLKGTYPRSEYFAVGALWFVSGFIALCTFMTGIHPFYWVKKFFSTKFWRKEI